MATFNNSTVEGGRIALDGNEYVGCTFKKCVFVFGGTAPVKLGKCSFVSCTWEFVGAAAQTIAFLKGLHDQGSGGKAVVDDIFRPVPPKKAKSKSK